MRLKSNLMESIINNLKEASILDYVDDKEKQFIEDILNSYSSTYNSIKYKYGNEMNATFENGISFYFIKVDGSYEYYVMDDKGNTTKSYPISYGLVDEARNFIPINESEDHNNTYYYDIHIVEDDATGMGYSVFIKTTKHYDEDLDADAIVDEAIKQNKLDTDEADYCDYISEISEQEYKDAVPHTENELVKDISQSELTESEDQDKFNYMMLSRLKSDCDYYLGNGNRNPRNLWAGDEAKQIAKMRELYDKVPEEPEWLTKEDIDDYEDKMINGSEDSPENHIENPTVIEDKDKINESSLEDSRNNVIKELSSIIEEAGLTYEEVFEDIYTRAGENSELIDIILSNMLEDYKEYLGEAAKIVTKYNLEESSVNNNSDIKKLEKYIKGSTLDDAAKFLGMYFHGDGDSFEVQGSELIDKKHKDNRIACSMDADKIASIADDLSNLKEDSYEDNIFTDIEDALNQYGLDVTRYTEAGIMTKNIGWIVSNSEGEVNLTCDGTYLDESITSELKENEEVNMAELKEKATDAMFDDLEKVFTKFGYKVKRVGDELELDSSDLTEEEQEACGKYIFGDSYSDGELSKTTNEENDNFTQLQREYFEKTGGVLICVFDVRYTDNDNIEYLYVSDVYLDYSDEAKSIIK